MKTCSTCHTEKDEGAFHRNKDSADGLLSICKDCAQRARHAKLELRDKDGRTCRDPRCEQRNPQPLDQFTSRGRVCQTCRFRNQAEANVQWHQDHPDDNARRAKAWRERRKNAGLPVKSKRSKERDNEQRRKRYAIDAEFRARICARRKDYWERNKTKCMEAQRVWHRSSEGRLWQRTYSKEYARKQRENKTPQHERQLEGQTIWRNRNWHTAVEGQGWVRTVESEAISLTYLRRLLTWQNGRCYICNNPFDHGIRRKTLEHLIARKRGGPSLEQNSVLSCQRCNFSRQDRYWGIEWEPDNVALDAGSPFVCWETIYRSLQKANLSPKRIDNGFSLSGPKGDRHFHIISTFAATERNPAAGRLIQKLLTDDSSRIIVTDHEWYRRQTAVLNMLQSKIGTSISDYSARQLDVIELNQSDANHFLTNHHIMGATMAPYRIALHDGKHVFGLGLFVDHGSYYDCVRLAFHGHVPGGMSRIIKHLSRLHSKKPIMSFVDSRYAGGEGHASIGFKKIDVSRETYVWVLPDRVQHQRYFSNDNKMSRNLLYFDPQLAKESLMKANGIFKLWMPQKQKMWLE